MQYYIMFHDFNTLLIDYNNYISEVIITLILIKHFFKYFYLSIFYTY